MVSSPRTVIEAVAADSFSVSGCDALQPVGFTFESSEGADCGPISGSGGSNDQGNNDQEDQLRTVATTAARRWYQHFGREAFQDYRSFESLPVKITIGQSCRRHVGLGSGTQLSMSIGLLLQRFFELPDPKPNEIAQALGRADRSAIGTFGFFEGGFLVDGGKTPAEPVSPIDLRLDFPEHWPIAIVNVNETATPKTSSVGLHGDAERAAFENVLPTTPEQLEQMQSLVNEKMVPSVVSENYDAFAESVHHYGRRSGEYFAAVQGGPYASETIAEVVKTIYQAGVKAVGQTSWGPSVFAIAENWEDLQSGIALIKQRFGDQCHIEITRADNQGVVITQQLARTSPQI